MAVAHVALWVRLASSRLWLEQIWGNAAVVLAPTLVAAWWLGRTDAAGTGPRKAAWWVSALAIVTLGSCVCVGYGATASLVVGLVLAVALSAGAVAQPTRQWLTLATWAFGVGTVGHVGGMLARHGTAGGEVARWIAALVAVIGPALLARWPAGRACLAEESPRGGTAWFFVALGVIYALAVAAGRNDLPQGLAIVAGFALLAGVLLTWMWQEAYRVAAWVLTLIAVGLVTANASGRMISAASFAVGAAWLPALFWARSDWLRRRWTKAGTDTVVTATVQTWLAGLLTAVALGVHSAGTERLWWFAGAATVAAVLARLGFAAVVEVATGFAVVGLGQAVELISRGDLDVSDLGPGFAAVAATAVVAMVLARFLPGGILWATPTMRQAREWLFSAMGLGVGFALMRGQIGALQPYITVGWGVAALAWFGFGLFARSRPDRLLGLGGLALCVPRMFLIDLHSTLYRIVAFGALGIVLLWVGFSYHRFRHLIAEDSPLAPDEADKKL